MLLVERAQLQGQTPLRQIGLIDEIVYAIEYERDVQPEHMLFPVGIESPRRKCAACGSDAQPIRHGGCDPAHVVVHQNVRVLGRDGQVLRVVRKCLHADYARVDQYLDDPAQ